MKISNQVFRLLALFLGAAVLVTAGLFLRSTRQKTPPPPNPSPAPSITFPVTPNPTASQGAHIKTPDKKTSSQSGDISAASQSPAANSGVPILMYHYVGNNPNPADHQRDILEITPDKLDAQFNWLSTHGYTPITLDTLYGIFAKKENVSKPIVLTFDDGYIDFYINAFQILKKYNFHAVSFIPTGLMEKNYYMSWGQMREIQASGLVSFQAHTVSHAYLPKLSYSDKLYELVTSKKTLEQQLGTTVNFIAYPYGASDPETWKAALSAGFVGGVGTWYGKAAGPDINMPRIRIVGTISLEDFVKKLSN